MKINECRRSQMHDYCLVNMNFQGKTFSYGKGNCNEEVFEIYFNNNGNAAEGHYYSRIFNLHLGEISPKKYTAELEFLKEEFNKVNGILY